MGITRFTTKVTLTTGVAKESTGAAVVGRPVWTVAWSVVETIDKWERPGRGKRTDLED